MTSQPYHSPCPGCGGKMPRHLVLCRECFFVVPPVLIDAWAWAGCHLASAPGAAIVKLLQPRRGAVAAAAQQLLPL